MCIHLLNPSIYEIEANLQTFFYDYNNSCQISWAGINMGTYVPTQSIIKTLEDLGYVINCNIDNGILIMAKYEGDDYPNLYLNLNEDGLLDSVSIFID